MWVVWVVSLPITTGIEADYRPVGGGGNTFLEEISVTNPHKSKKGRTGGFSLARTESGLARNGHWPARAEYWPHGGAKGRTNGIFAARAGELRARVGFWAAGSGFGPHGLKCGLGGQWEGGLLESPLARVAGLRLNSRPMTKDQTSGLRHFINSFTDILKCPQALWFIIAVFVVDSAAYFGVLTLMTTYLSTDLGWGDKWAGVSVSVFTMLITLLMLGLGSLADGFGLRRAIIAGLVMTVIGRLLYCPRPAPLPA